jgi:hypothetical protein
MSLGPLGLPGIDNKDFVSLINSIDRLNITNPNVQFVGRAENVTAYGSVSFFVRAQDATGILTAQFGNDANFLTMQRVFPIDYTGSTTRNNSNYYEIPIMGKFFRMVCGGTTQSDVGTISVQTVYHSDVAQIRKFSISNTLINYNINTTGTMTINGLWDICDGATSLAVSISVVGFIGIAPISINMQFATTYNGNLTTSISSSQPVSSGQTYAIFNVGGQYFQPSYTLPEGNYFINVQISLMYGGESTTNDDSGDENASGLLVAQNKPIFSMDTLLGLQYGQFSVSSLGSYSVPSFNTSFGLLTGISTLTVNQNFTVNEGETHCFSFGTHFSSGDIAFIGIVDLLGNQTGMAATNGTGYLIVSGQTVSLIRNPPFDGFSYFNRNHYRIFIYGCFQNMFQVQVYNNLTVSWIDMYRNMGTTSDCNTFTIQYIESDMGDSLVCFGSTWSLDFESSLPRLDYQNYLASLSAENISASTYYQALAIHLPETNLSYLIDSVDVAIEQLSLNRIVSIQIYDIADPSTTFVNIDSFSLIQQAEAGVITSQKPDNLLYGFTCMSGESKTISLTNIGIRLNPGTSYSLVFFCTTTLNNIQASINLRR